MTRFEARALGAWAACWTVAALCGLYLYRTRTPKGDR